MSLHGFNLLQGSVRPADSWDKVNEWVTNVGRVIVMVVEIVVILSFGARVVIDTQTKNLLEAEATNSQALAAFRQTEIVFRDRQDRFSGYKSLWNASSSYSSTISDITTPLPTGAENLTMNIQGNLVTINGEASASEVQSFETRLKNSDLYSDVQVHELERIGSNVRGDDRFAFGIRVLLKEENIISRNKFVP